MLTRTNNAQLYHTIKRQGASDTIASESNASLGTCEFCLYIEAAVKAAGVSGQERFDLKVISDTSELCIYIDAAAKAAGVTVTAETDVLAKLRLCCTTCFLLARPQRLEYLRLQQVARLLQILGPDARVAESLVNLDRAIDCANKKETRVEANGAREHKKTIGQDEHVAKVKNTTDRLADVQLGEKVKGAIGKQIQSAGTACQVGTPPPMIVLAAQLEIAENDGYLRTRYNQDHENEGQKPEYVIKLVEPHRCEDEEELNEYGTEGENAADKNCEDLVHVPGLLRDLTWDLVGPDWIFNSLFLETKVRAHEHKGDRYAEPKEDQDEEGSKWDGAGGFLPPDERVKDAEHDKDDTWKYKRCFEGVDLPVNALEHLVQASANIAIHDAHNHIQQEHGSHQSPSVCGRQETEDSEHHCDASHTDQLESSTDKD